MAVAKGKDMASIFWKTLNDAVLAADALHNGIVAYTTADASEEDKEKIVPRVETFKQALERAMDEVRVRFPPPHHAPSHVEREELVDYTLARASAAMMDAFKDLGAQGETAARLEESLNTLMSLVRTLIILAGEYQPPRLTLMLRCITDDGWTER